MSSVECSAGASVEPQGEARFSALELQVLRMAQSRRESPSGRPSLIAKLALGNRAARMLADPRLEALRTYAAAVRSGRKASRALLAGFDFSAGQIDSIDRMMRRARSTAAGGAPWMYHAGVALGMASMVGFIGMTGALIAGV